MFPSHRLDYVQPYAQINTTTLVPFTAFSDNPEKQQCYSSAGLWLPFYASEWHRGNGVIDLSKLSCQRVAFGNQMILHSCSRQRSPWSGIRPAIICNSSDSIAHNVMLCPWQPVRVDSSKATSLNGYFFLLDTVLQLPVPAFVPSSREWGVAGKTTALIKMFIIWSKATCYFWKSCSSVNKYSICNISCKTVLCISNKDFWRCWILSKFLHFHLFEWSWHPVDSKDQTKQRIFLFCPVLISVSTKYFKNTF